MPDVPAQDRTLDEGQRPVRRQPLARVVGRLTSVNLLIAAVGLLTGPLLARALGPEGRGLLAAILVPLGLAPVLAGLGVGTFVATEVARGRRAAGLLLGSMLPITVASSVVVVLASPAIAALFAGNRTTVSTLIVIGLCVLPIGLIFDLWINVAHGQERWNTLIAVRLIPPVVMAVGISALFVADALSVATAAGLSIVAGTLVVAPALPVVRRTGRLSLDRALTREGARFSAKAWIGGLGSAANARLDQLLMIRLVPPADLGLYVVAVTAAGFLVTPVLGALTSGSLPRFATAGRGLVTSVLRVCLLGCIVVSALLAAALPFLIPPVFGSDFAGSVELAWILLAAGVPLTGVHVLSVALTASGHPGFSAVSQVVTLVITIPTLIVLLPMFGATAAACTSLGAYSASFLFLLVAARRHLGGTMGDFVMIRGADARQLIGLVRGRFPGSRR